MRTSITNYVATVVAVLAAGPVATHPGAPATGEDVSSDAKSAAVALSAFLEDGEDGCTCGADLRGLVKSFQEAHNGDPSGRGQRSAHPETGLVPTDGYLEASTARALAAYSGAWFAPCYGAFNSRCGDVPVTNGSTPRAPGVCVESTTQAGGSGGCLPWNFGAPGGGTTCKELRPVVIDGSVGTTDVEEMNRLKARLRSTCGDGQVARLVHDWVYDERGCPVDGRIAGCHLTDPNDPRATVIEWFYGAATTVDEVRRLCVESGRALVMP